MILRPAARAAAPGPELLARDDIVVGNAHDAGVLPVIVAGKKILLVIPGKHRISAVMIFVPAHINALGEVRAGVLRRRNRPGGKVALGVMSHKLRAGRKDDLVAVVDVDRDIGEAQHRSGDRGPVHHAERRLEIGLSRIERHAHGPAHAIAQFQLPYPYRL